MRPHWNGSKHPNLVGSCRQAHRFSCLQHLAMNQISRQSRSRRRPDMFLCLTYANFRPEMTLIQIKTRAFQALIPPPRRQLSNGSKLISDWPRGSSTLRNRFPGALVGKVLALKQRIGWKVRWGMYILPTIGFFEHHIFQSGSREEAFVPARHFILFANALCDAIL